MPGNVAMPANIAPMQALAFGAENAPAVAVSEANPVPVRGTTPRLTGSLSIPASATVYTAGDLIGNSMTAASVVPITFTLARPAGRISGVRAVLTAASGTIVFPAFDLVLFRPQTSIPFAAAGYPADNAALNIASAAYAEVVAVLSFSATAWRNQAGGSTAAGLTAYQAVALPVRPYAPFNVTGLATQELRGLIHAQSAWDKANVAYTLDFALDADLD